MLAAVCAKAQIRLELDDKFVSLDKKLITAAVDSSLCIVRQDYVLKDTNDNAYGRQNRDYFGRTYQLGVITGNRVWVDKKTATPWTLDGSYDNYKNNDTIKPELSHVAVRFLPGTTFRSLDYKIDNSTEGYATYPLETESITIPNIRRNKQGDGWLVVVHSREDITLKEDCALEYTIYMPNLSIGEKSSEAVVKKMPVKEKILGGVYYTYQIKAGQVQFLVAGILKKKGSEWVIESLPDLEESAGHSQLTIIKNLADQQSAKNKDSAETGKPEKKQYKN